MFLILAHLSTKCTINTLKYAQVYLFVHKDYWPRPNWVPCVLCFVTIQFSWALYDYDLLRFRGIL